MRKSLSPDAEIREDRLFLLLPGLHLRAVSRIPAAEAEQAFQA